MDRLSMIDEPPLRFWNRISLTDNERAIILYMAETGRSDIEIAGATGRILATVKSEIARLRRIGVIGYRRPNKARAHA